MTDKIRLSLPARNSLRAAVLAVLSAAPVLQAATVPPGGALDASEFLVNSANTGGQKKVPGVARDAAGDFVVVWKSLNQAASNSTYDIYAQRYAAAGQPQGSEFLVNTYTSGLQGAPAVAMDAAGDFVVVWQSNNQAGTNSQYDIYARQFNASGTALQSSEFLVNTFNSNIQSDPAVAMDAAGDFVVAWDSFDQIDTNSFTDIFVRRYNGAGVAQGSEFLVNTVTSNTQMNPAVAMDAAGDFVVAWQSYYQVDLNSYFDIYARQYTSAGSAAQASEFLVNTTSSGDQTMPAVAMDAAGDFVVAWQTDANPGGGSIDVDFRKFTAAGIPLVADVDFVANTHTQNTQSAESVAMDATGEFVIAWESFGQAGSTSQYDIYARQYNASGGALQTSELLVNTHTTLEQRAPAVAMDAAGDYVIAWQSYDQLSLAGYDIYARRYQGPETVDLMTVLLTKPSASVSAGTSFSIDLAVDNASGVQNTGNTTIDSALGVASGITAVFTLPAGLKADTGGGGLNWACGAQSGNTITCTYSTPLAAGAAADGVALGFTAPAVAGKLTFTSVVSSNLQQSGSDSTGNTASATVDVQAASTGGNGSGGSSGGSGAFGLLSLAFLGLPLLRRRKRRL